MIGNDGGLDISYDQGRTWDFVATMATGLAYVVTADNEHPYNVYTGLQDNNSWGGPSSKRGRGGITNMDWFGICGGDGFYTGVNVNNPNFIFCESQDGNTSRYDLNAGQTVSIKPNAGPRVQLAGGAAGARRRRRVRRRPRAGRRPGGGGGGGGRGGAAARKNVINADGGEAYRFNWNTPYELSPHNPDIIYLGGNRLFKSYDRGTSWVASPDLTKQVDRCKVTVMGVARRQVAAVQERRPVGVQHDHRGDRVAGDAGRRLGRHRRRQPAGEPRRRPHVHRSRQEHPGPAAGRAHERRSVLDLAHRRVALRRGHGVRLDRRTSQRRPASVRVRHARLRQDVPRTSRTTCRRTATCRSFAKIPRTRTCCSSAPSSGSSPLSMAASTGRSS